MAIIYRGVSVDGIKIHAPIVSTVGGSLNKEFIFADTGGRYVQKIADYPQSFSIKGDIFGASAKYKKDRLLNIAKENKIVKLQVGSLGVYNVNIIGQVTVEEDIKKFSTYNVSFECGVSQQTPFPQFVGESPSGLIAKFNDIFFSPFEKSKDTVDAVLDKTTDFFGLIDTFNGISQFKFYQDRFNGFFNSIGDTLQGLSTDKRELSSIASQLFNVNKTALPSLLGIFKKTIDVLSNEEENNMELYKSILDKKTYLFEKNEHLVKQQISHDILNIKKDKELDKITEVFRQLFYVNYCESAIKNNFLLKTEIQKELRNIDNIFYNFEERKRVETITTATKSALIDLQLAAFDVEEINVGTFISYSVLSQALYGTDEFAERLYKLNNNHIMFGNSGQVKVFV